MAYESNNTGQDMDGLRYTGTIGLTAPFSTPMALANTYYKMLGVFGISGINKEFTANVDGSLTYNGEDGWLEVNGTSDVALTSAGKLTYALFRNDVLIPEAQSPHDFVANDKSENMSITGPIYAETGDVFQVYGQTDVIGNTVTPANLNVVFRKV